MEAVSIFAQAVIYSAAVTSATFIIRLSFQVRADRMRRTYELSFPRGMTQTQVLDFVRSAVGELPRPKFLQPAYTLVFEKYADKEGKRYYLHIPGHVRTKVDKLLDKKIEGISIEPVHDEDDRVARTKWEEATEITMRGSNSLRVKVPEHVASSIDANFDALDEDEALVLQWVVLPDRPRRPDEGDKDKMADYTLNAVARIAACGKDARQMLANLGGSLRSVDSAGTVFKKRLMFGVSKRIRRRAGTLGYPIFLNAPEFTAIMGWQLDGQTGTLTARSLPVTKLHQTGDILLGTSNFPKMRGQRITMPHDAGDMHISLIGGSGTGKSKYLLNLGLQKLSDPETAFFLLEPAGDLALDFLNCIPKHRVADTIYLDPLDTYWPIGINPLQGTDPERITAHIVGVFKTLSGDSWGHQLQRVLTNAVYTAALTGATLYDVRQLLVNKEYRSQQLRKLKRAQYPDIFQEWDWIDGKADMVTDSSVNRIDTFLSSPMIRNIVSQKNGLDFEWIIREHKILLVPLPAARMGQMNASALGQLVREMAWNAAMRQPPGQRSRSVVLMDEVQNFADWSTSKSDPFSEARKYQQQYIIANQYTDQLPLAVQHTVFKNVATQMVFRLDTDDARKVKDRYAPLTEHDISNLPRYHVAARIMSDEGIAPIVTMKTPPIPAGTGFARQIIENTRSSFARPVSEVTAEIMERHKRPEPNRRPKIGGRDATL